MKKKKSPAFDGDTRTRKKIATTADGKHAHLGQIIDFLLDDLELPRQIYLFPILHDLAHVAGREAYDLHVLLHVSLRY